MRPFGYRSFSAYWNTDALSAAVSPNPNLAPRQHRHRRTRLGEDARSRSQRRSTPAAPWHRGRLPTESSHASRRPHGGPCQSPPRRLSALEGIGTSLAMRLRYKHRRERSCSKPTPTTIAATVTSPSTMAPAITPGSVFAALAREKMLRRKKRPAAVLSHATPSISQRFTPGGVRGLPVTPCYARDRQSGANTGSVSRSTSRTRKAIAGRASRTTTTAHARPTRHPASTSAG
jgi:hypothetical protein